ncbi:MAG: hypothetical protein SFV32_11900 [Opitutaceae bacterium]|nr:hypothetical protein [Opitutaceae bacterium]
MRAAHAARLFAISEWQLASHSYREALRIPASRFNLQPPAFASRHSASRGLAYLNTTIRTRNRDSASRFNAQPSEFAARASAATPPRTHDALLLKLYYSLKPYLPIRLRYWLRAQRAARLRIRHANTWPIDPAAAQKPEGWRGWPNGKDFAFVLTHDVEGPVGYEKVRDVALLEEKLGFRSAFHFVPEGTYTVSSELREDLVRRGFEVGVHDLHHDGSLYASVESFRRQAPRINHYLADWQAGGFRAGFMFHNLDWIRDQLTCAYDLSTFDTDPFEPQPDAARTIFPFFVRDQAPSAPSALPPNPPSLPRHSDSEPASAPSASTTRSLRSSFLELPYTLPQDSTLFLILGEESPKIWIEKLDWVAAHGGMALVNVHPDYLRMREDDIPNTTYPLSHYTALLEHVNARYGDRVWKALPKDVYQWCESNRG